MGGVVEPLFGLVGDQEASWAKRTARSQNIFALGEASRFSEADAQDALVRGNMEAGRRRMAGSALLAKQRVAFANSGVDATVGTPVDVAFGAGVLNELDALTIENNAAREALGHKRTASKYTQQIQVLNAEQKTEDTADNIAMAGRFAKFLTSAASMGGG